MQMVQHLFVLLLRARQNVARDEARNRMPIVLPVLGRVIGWRFRQRSGSDEDVRVKDHRSDRDQSDHDVVVEQILKLVPLEPGRCDGEVLRSMASRHRTGANECIFASLQQGRFVENRTNTGRNCPGTSQGAEDGHLFV
uniref:Uncharacterized protein n=1 Tax=Anopheles aquasalis TaxID=42839 RepID=T1DNL8_ANOAQ